MLPLPNKMKTMRGESSHSRSHSLRLTHACTVGIQAQSTWAAPSCSGVALVHGGPGAEAAAPGSLREPVHEAPPPPLSKS